VDRRECHLLAEFFCVFSHRTRLQMFCALQSGRKTVSELAEFADISLQNASQHLRLMREKGVLVTEKEAQRVYYRIVDERFIQAARLMRDAVVDTMMHRMEQVHLPAPAQPSQHD
jgi:ArsR family transcriptional regulator